MTDEKLQYMMTNMGMTKEEVLKMDAEVKDAP